MASTHKTAHSYTLRCVDEPIKDLNTIKPVRMYSKLCDTIDSLGFQDVEYDGGQNRHGWDARYVYENDLGNRIYLSAKFSKKTKLKGLFKQVEKPISFSFRMNITLENIDTSSNVRSTLDKYF